MVRIMLKERLVEKGWNQADLARHTGIRPSTINEYYHELSERINLEYLDLICKALDCDVCDILTVNYERIQRVNRVARRNTHVVIRIEGADASSLIRDIAPPPKKKVRIGSRV